MARGMTKGKTQNQTYNKDCEGKIMVFKLKLKNQEAREYTQILTVFTANNDNTGEKLLTVVTSGKSECYSMSEVEDFEVIGCGKCN